jgi:hypothetical protein
MYRAGGIEVKPGRCRGRDYGPLAPLVSHADRTIDTELIVEQWDRVRQYWDSIIAFSRNLCITL